MKKQWWLLFEIILTTFLVIGFSKKGLFVDAIYYENLTQKDRQAIVSYFLEGSGTLENQTIALKSSIAVLSEDVYMLSHIGLLEREKVLGETEKTLAEIKKDRNFVICILTSPGGIIKTKDFRLVSVRLKKWEKEEEELLSHARHLQWILGAYRKINPRIEV